MSVPSKKKRNISDVLLTALSPSNQRKIMKPLLKRTLKINKGNGGVIIPVEDNSASPQLLVDDENAQAVDI